MELHPRDHVPGCVDGPGDSGNPEDILEPSNKDPKAVALSRELVTGTPSHPRPNERLVLCLPTCKVGRETGWAESQQGREYGRDPGLQ
eukprot:5538716-Heterocapsa_arctica.AAC.1